MSRKIVVVGSGAAGMTAASSARRQDPEAEITVFTEDEHFAYSPCAIPYVIEGKIENLAMHNRYITGTWKSQRGSGEFKASRQ